jgi:hypothetical protein
MSDANTAEPTMASARVDTAEFELGLFFGASFILWVMGIRFGLHVYPGRGFKLVAGG